MNSLPDLSVHSELTFDRLRHGSIPNLESLCFSPDGGLLCAASEGIVRIWSMPGGSLVHELEGQGAAFTREGDLVRRMAAGNSSWIEILSLPSLELMTRFQAHQGPLYNMVISPDGSTVACGGYQQVVLWSRDNPRKLKALPTHRRVTGEIAFTPDGHSLVTRSFGDIAVWSRDGKRLSTIEIGSDVAGGLAISPRGIVALTNRQHVELWDMDGGRLAQIATEHYMASVTFSPDGDWLAAGSQQGEILILDVENRKVSGSLKGARGHVPHLAWTPRGILAGESHGDVSLWSEQPIGSPTPRAAARADDGQCSERLERLRQKLANHGLHLQAPSERSQVDVLESQHGVTLPLGYRRFIMEVGDGGAGPPPYGLVSLQQAVESNGAPHQLGVPFPLTKTSYWLDEEENWGGGGDIALEAVVGQGYLHLGTDGCGIDWILVVSGSERGHIWRMDEVGATPVTPRRDFLSWYEYWIDGGDLSEQMEDGAGFK